MTPADQIRAALRQAANVERGVGVELGRREALEALAALDALEAEHAELEDRIAAYEANGARVEHREGICEVYDWTGKYVGCIGVEAWIRQIDDHKVWLTRDEANRIRAGLDIAGKRRLLALLDERLGDKS